MSPDPLDALSKPIDKSWKEVANQLAGPLRRYTMVSERRLSETNRVLCEVRVSHELHRQAIEALDRLGELVYSESHQQASKQARKTMKSKPSPAKPRPRVYQ